MLQKLFTVKTMVMSVIVSVIWCLSVLFLPIRMEVCVKDPVYENRAVNPNNMYVRLYSYAGMSKKLDDRWVKMTCTQNDLENTLHASFLYLRETFTFDSVPIKTIEASYNEKVYPGDPFEKERVMAKVIYENGHEVKEENFNIPNAPERFGDRTCKFLVDTIDGTAVAAVDPVNIKSVTADIKEDVYQYDIPKFSKIRIVYEDGEEKTLDKEKVEFTPDINRPMEKLGQQTLYFTYRGVKYPIRIDVLENTNATNARRQYAEEIKNAEMAHLSKTLFVTITKHEEAVGTYYLTHVVVADSSQICSDLSYGDWGGPREKPSSAAQRLGLVVAANASYFSYKTSAPRCTDMIIKNGVFYGSKKYSNGKTNGQEICLMRDGSLYTPPEGMSARQLISMGVIDTWAAGDPLLIQNGKLLSTKHDWVYGKYPRTAIGMLKPCEYYLLTAGSGGYRGGLTFDDVQRIYNDLGCPYARTFDGGGSSSLVFDDGDGPFLVNAPAGGSERPVVDIIGFSE